MSSFLGTHSFAASKLNYNDFQYKLAQKTLEVKEFAAISELASKMNLRVWLAFGSAASFAYHIKFSILAKQEPHKYNKDYEHLAYSNLFRSNQDLDLVLDATPEESIEFQKRLLNEYPYLAGLKIHWDLRTLNYDIGNLGDISYREALLQNWSFAHQHSDSHSLGLIELRPLSDYNKSPLVRDARNWDSNKSQFLQDVLDSNLSIYYSNSHAKTERYKNGTNPAYFPAIRALIKASQYNAKINSNGMRALSQMFQSLPRANGKISDFEKKFLARFIPKLFHNSIDLNYTHFLIDALRIRQRLIEIADAIDNQDIKWWLQRSPLPNYSQKKYSAKHSLAKQIAQQLGVHKIVLMHSFKTFGDYESIIRSPYLQMNAFREEQIVLGNGIVLKNRGIKTQLMQAGTRLSGYNVIYELKPDAVSEYDFMYFKDKQVFIILNADAVVRVQMQESFHTHFTNENILSVLLDANANKQLTRNMTEELELGNSFINPNVLFTDARFYELFDSGLNNLDIQNAPSIMLSPIIQRYLLYQHQLKLKSDASFTAYASMTEEKKLELLAFLILNYESFQDRELVLNFIESNFNLLKQNKELKGREDLKKSMQNIFLQNPAKSKLPLMKLYLDFMIQNDAQSINSYLSRLIEVSSFLNPKSYHNFLQKYLTQVYEHITYSDFNQLVFKLWRKLKINEAKKIKAFLNALRFYSLPQSHILNSNDYQLPELSNATKQFILNDIALLKDKALMSYAIEVFANTETHKSSMFYEYMAAQKQNTNLQNWNQSNILITDSNKELIDPSIMGLTMLNFKSKSLRISSVNESNYSKTKNKSAFFHFLITHSKAIKNQKDLLEFLYLYILDPKNKTSLEQDIKKLTQTPASLRIFRTINYMILNNLRNNDQIKLPNAYLISILQYYKEINDAYFTTQLIATRYENFNSMPEAKALLFHMMKSPIFLSSFELHKLYVQISMNTPIHNIVFINHLLRNLPANNESIKHIAQIFLMSSSTQTKASLEQLLKDIIERHLQNNRQSFPFLLRQIKSIFLTNDLTNMVESLAQEMKEKSYVYEARLLQNYIKPENSAKSFVQFLYESKAMEQAEKQKGTECALIFVK